MRRWLPIALLLALAGLITLAIVRFSTREDLATGLRVASDVHPHAEPIEAELAAQPDAREQRSDVALPSAASRAPESNEPATRLVVRAVGKLDHAPLASVRVYVSLKVPAPGYNGVDYVPGQKGDLHKAPITGSDGLVEFELPPRTELSLTAEGEDGSSGTTVQDLAGLHDGERREIVVELPQGDDAHLEGKVVSAESGVPIAGARVALVRADASYSSDSGPGWTKLELAHTTTGAQGGFEFRYPSWKRAHLRVEAEGYGLRLVSPPAEQPLAPQPLLVKLVQGCTLVAHVLDAAGKAVSGASVVLDARGYALGRSGVEDNGFFMGGYVSLPDEQWTCEIGADGTALIQGLPADVGLVAEVRREGKVLRREAAELTLVAGETRELEWRIGAGSRVIGLVLDQNKQPVKGQEFWLEPCMFERGFYFQGYTDERIVKRASTDEQGRFVIEDVPAGKWWIGPAAERIGWGTPKPEAVAPVAEVLTTAGESVLEPTLHVFRGIYIRGTIVDPSGAPAGESYVRGESEGALLWNGMRSRDDGLFAFGPLVPGNYTLTADGSGSFAPSEPVQARAGDTGVVLRLKPGASIRGHVIDAATGAGCQAQLVFSPEQPGSGIFGSGLATSTSSDGSFKHEGFEPGRYGITAMTADGRFAQQAGVDVGAGSESGEIVLALKPGGKLRLLYQGSRPRLFVRISCGGAPVNFGDSLVQGKTKELLAPAGSLVLELRVEWNGVPRLKMVELRAGETKEVALTDEN